MKERNERRFQAALFDWDGLLADTEPCWSIADQVWLGNNGYDYNDELKDQLTGRGQSECIGAFRARFGFTIPTDEAIRQRLSALREVYGSLDYDILMPGAKELVEGLFYNDKKIAIASGSAQQTLDLVVEKQGIREFFDIVMSSDCVPRGKPAPDVYLEAARRLGISTLNCIVFEDAQSGIEAAHSAGMYSVAVPNKYTFRQDFSKANRVYPSLESIPLETLDRFK